MMRLNPSHKTIILVILLLITIYSTISCTNQTKNGQPVEETVIKRNTKSEYPYSISLVDTSEFRDLPWWDKLSFNVIQIRDMPKDKLSLENVMNENIKRAMTSWIRGKVINPALDSVQLEITCHSNRYLSFKNSFIYEGNHRDFIDNYVTIDMTTGQRVYLNDLLKVNKDFVKFLMENPGIIKMPDDQELWKGGVEVSDYSASELLEELNKCSYTDEQWIQNGYYPIEESFGAFIRRNSFFLRDGMLVISLPKGGERFMSLDVGDIKDFLKVDEW